MMNVVMIMLGLLYLAIAFLWTRMIVSEYLFKSQSSCTKTQKLYQKLIQKKEDFDIQIRRLENQATEIFALYEMTKEITKKLKGEEAFKIFKEKLKENVSFRECRLWNPQEQVKITLPRSDIFTFALTEQDKVLGNLVLEGVKEEEKEKILILIHQFVLALRRIKLHEEIEKLAMTDSLTGIFTRRYILERFEEELKRAKAKKIRLSFLMLDVDHFKSINDQYGHLTGDQILREIARVVQESIREIDIVGRYGGEEFCVVLPDTDKEGASYVAERIRTSVEETSIKVYDVIIKTTVSIGISLFPDHGEDSQEIIEKADSALYHVKKMGRNQVSLFA